MFFVPVPESVNTVFVVPFSVHGLGGAHQADFFFAPKYLSYSNVIGVVGLLIRRYLHG